MFLERAENKGFLLNLKDFKYLFRALSSFLKITFNFKWLLNFYICSLLFFIFIKIVQITVVLETAWSKSAVVILARSVLLVFFFNF